MYRVETHLKPHKIISAFEMKNAGLYLLVIIPYLNHLKLLAYCVFDPIQGIGIDLVLYCIHKTPQNELDKNDTCQTLRTEQ